MKSSLTLLSFIFLFLCDCSLRRKNDDDGPEHKDDPPQSRPDAQGVMPKTGLLGASFANASIEGAAVKLLNSSKYITLPNLLKQSCRFSDFGRNKRFSWDFLSEDSGLNGQSLNVELTSTVLPVEGSKFTLAGTMSAAGNVSFRGVQESTDGFGYWTTNGFSTNSTCDLTVAIILNGKGEKITDPTSYSGPFRIDSLLHCHLQNFFDFSSSTASDQKFLNFDAALGCTGDSNQSSKISFKKWFISSQMKSFELSDDKMVASIAKTYCASKQFSYKLPTVDQLTEAADEIKGNFFSGLVDPIRVWALDKSGSGNLVAVDNFLSKRDVATDFDVSSMGYVICVH